MTVTLENIEQSIPLTPDSCDGHDCSVLKSVRGDDGDE